MELFIQKEHYIHIYPFEDIKSCHCTRITKELWLYHKKFLHKELQNSINILGFGSFGVSYTASRTT